jgi:hypothetical protein
MVIDYNTTDSVILSKSSLLRGGEYVQEERQ